MIDKQAPDFFDMVKACFPFLTTFILSLWGGTVSHIQKIRKAKRKFTIGQEYWMDIIICSFAGLLTHFFCQYASVDGWLQAILVSISAHMGTRAIASFESLHRRFFSSKE